MHSMVVEGAWKQVKKLQNIELKITSRTQQNHHIVPSSEVCLVLVGNVSA